MTERSDRTMTDEELKARYPRTKFSPPLKPPDNAPLASDAARYPTMLKQAGRSELYEAAVRALAGVVTPPQGVAEDDPQFLLFKAAVEKAGISPADASRLLAACRSVSEPVGSGNMAPEGSGQIDAGNF